MNCSFDYCNGQRNLQTLEKDIYFDFIKKHKEIKTNVFKYTSYSGTSYFTASYAITTTPSVISRGLCNGKEISGARKRKKGRKC